MTSKGTRREAGVFGPPRHKTGCCWKDDVGPTMSVLFLGPIVQACVDHSMLLYLFIFGDSRG